MKKLIKLLSILVASTPISLNAVACCESGEKTSQNTTLRSKTKQKTKIEDLKIDIKADFNEKKQVLVKKIIKDKTEIENLNSKLTDSTINDFNITGCENNLNNDYETYKYPTFSINKNDNTIIEDQNMKNNCSKNNTTLAKKKPENILPITSKNKSIINSLWKIIKQTINIEKQPLETVIKNEIEVIDLNHNLVDPNINNLNNSSNKIDLSHISKLNGLTIISNPTKLCEDLIIDINKSDEFKSNNLAEGYKFQFYRNKNKKSNKTIQSWEYFDNISVEITSSLNDPNYKGSTKKIDITDQIIIPNEYIQNHFKDKTLNFAQHLPLTISIKATSNKTEAVQNIMISLKTKQKSKENLIKQQLLGIYKQKIDFKKLNNDGKIYDMNDKEINDNWFEDKKNKKPAKVKVFYGDIKEKGYFCPIKINII